VDTSASLILKIASSPSMEQEMRSGSVLCTTPRRSMLLQ
jgi:hypothetical protein